MLLCRSTEEEEAREQEVWEAVQVRKQDFTGSWKQWEKVQFQDNNVEFVEGLRSTGRDRWTWIFTQVKHNTELADLIKWKNAFDLQTLTFRLLFSQSMHSVNLQRCLSWQSWPERDHGGSPAWEPRHGRGSGHPLLLNQQPALSGGQNVFN